MTKFLYLTSIMTILIRWVLVIPKTPNIGSYWSITVQSRVTSSSLASNRCVKPWIFFQERIADNEYAQLDPVDLLVVPFKHDVQIRLVITLGYMYDVSRNRICFIVMPLVVSYLDKADYEGNCKREDRHSYITCIATSERKWKYCQWSSTRGKKNCNAPKSEIALRNTTAVLQEL